MMIWKTSWSATLWHLEEVMWKSFLECCPLDLPVWRCWFLLFCDKCVLVRWLKSSPGFIWLFTRIEIKAKETPIWHQIQSRHAQPAWWTAWRELERETYGEQMRNSSCRRSVVVVVEPSTLLCPIDFSSATNWTIFHTVLLWPHLPFIYSPI